ncbi:MAG: EAL domain-containing protein [Acidovorax sp.]
MTLSLLAPQGWQAALDALSEAVWLVDEASLAILLVNRAAEQLTGVAAQDMLGRSMRSLAATPQDLVLWGEEGAGARDGSQTHTRVLRSDGALVPVEQRVHRLAQSASPTGGSVLVVTMVDRREQEASERELETLLSELRATLDSAADGVLVCGMDGQLRAFNQRLATLWNMPRELLTRRDDEAIRQHMLAQVSEPQAYTERLAALAFDPRMESTDILTLHSGAVIERRSVPQLVRGLPVGRVYSFRDLTLHYAAQRRIEELAYSDVLTGLPNRLMLSRRVDGAIEAARRSGTGFAVMFLDLDRFKIINDSLGHPFGDRVLKLVAQRLQDCLRQTDMLCRLGGDEFVIYLHGCDADVAEAVAHRVLESMLRPLVLDGMGFSVGCSIGMALYPQDGQTLDELIKQADTAMYRVKERGRGNFGFYQPQMNAGLLSRVQLEHAMRQALAHDRMAVHFQPLVCMTTGRITGAEALLRWHDPEFGAVAPGMFIPLAEESGYIVTLGAWVLEQSVREAVRWLREGRPVRLSVNVSALEFRQPDFVQRVMQVLEAEGLPSKLLELELTETILLQDAHEMELRLQALADLGVGLVIDDFGTGYSSLAYLKKLPIHKLKIDQSFVRGLPHDEGDRAIVGAIVHMGRALRIEVVAEGVETDVQRAALEELDCHQYQGFLCAPGLPPQDFRELLAQRGVQGDEPCI